LSAAEPDDPQDAVVAKQFKETPRIYRKTAKLWAEVYAGGEMQYFFSYKLCTFSPCGRYLNLWFNFLPSYYEWATVNRVQGLVLT